MEERSLLVYILSNVIWQRAVRLCSYKVKKHKQGTTNLESQRAHGSLRKLRLVAWRLVRLALILKLLGPGFQRNCLTTT